MPVFTIPVKVDIDGPGASSATAKQILDKVIEKGHDALLDIQGSGNDMWPDVDIDDITT